MNNANGWLRAYEKKRRENLCKAAQGLKNEGLRIEIVKEGYHCLQVWDNSLVNVVQEEVLKLCLSTAKKYDLSVNAGVKEDSIYGVRPVIIIV